VKKILTAVLLLPLLPAALAAAVVEVTDHGFLVRQEATVAAPPDSVYAALIRVDRWWSPDHTWSGDAANLFLEPRAGGMFGERLPGGGSVEHLRVVRAEPGRRLVLRG